MKIALLVTVALLLAAVPAQAAVKTETITYKQGDTTLEGFLAYDDTAQSKRPGVLVFHEWTGLNDYAKQRAEQLAHLGYVAFAADVYGKGVRAKDPQEAAKLAGVYKNDRALMRARVTAALDVFKARAEVDPHRIGAMGYCFGGTCALELARSGAPVVGVVSFHGGLATPTPQDARNVKGRLLILHGAADPFVPPAEVTAFETEMKNAGVRYKLVAYPNAVHSFTNPGAGTDASKGAAHNAEADKASWEAMKAFFAEVFNKG